MKSVSHSTWQPKKKLMPKLVSSLWSSCICLFQQIPWACTTSMLGPLHIDYSCWSSVLGKFLKVGVRVSLTLLLVLRTSSLQLGCLTQPWFECLFLVLLFLLLCSINVPGRTDFFLGETGRVDLVTRGVEDREE